MAGDQIRLTPMGGVKAFNCRNCGGQVTLLAPGQSIAAACQHCGAVADLTDDNFRILSRFQDAAVHKPRYEIGAKAEFEGHKWVVIGFMMRTVRLYSFDWEEYLLFNPYHGYRFLAHAYGHWSWIKMINDGPLGLEHYQVVTYNKEKYKNLTEGEAEVTYVVGEFYWQVKVGDVALTRDLVAPPRMLSMEREGGGIIWSLGEYLEPSAVEKAFGMPPNPKMARKGVGANQPNRFAANFKAMRPVWILSLILSVAMFVGLMNMHKSTEVQTANYAFPDSLDKVTPPFELHGGTNNVEIGLRATEGLDNKWVEFEGVLHNLDNNQNYEFVVGAEYYHGVEDGESWSEGSTSDEFVLNEIPDGIYEMVTSSSSDGVGKAKLTVTRSVPIFSNLLIVLVLLSIMPLITLFLSRNFEKQREA